MPIQIIFNCQTMTSWQQIDDDEFLRALSAYLSYLSFYGQVDVDAEVKVIERGFCRRNTVPWSHLSLNVGDRLQRVLTYDLPRIFYVT